MAQQRRREAPRDRAPREAAIRGVLALTPQDQIEATLALVELLGGEVGGESTGERRLRRPAQALRDLDRSAAALGLEEGKAPTFHQHDEQARKLGLLSSQQIVRAFGRWSNATRAFRGERAPETPEQRAKRVTTAGKQRDHRDQLAGIQMWLDSMPQSISQASYDAFAGSYSEQLDEDDLPLVSAQAARVALGISWKEILEVARGEKRLAEVLQARRARVRRDAGSIGLVGAGAAARVLGLATTAVTVIENQPGFPVWVARFGKSKAWLLEDIEAWAGDRQVPARLEGEIQAELMESAELAALLDVQLESLHAYVNAQRWTLVPPPGAIVSQRHVWRRIDVEAWSQSRGPKLPTGRKSRAKEGSRRPKTRKTRASRSGAAEVRFGCCAYRVGDGSSQRNRSVAAQLSLGRERIYPTP